MVPTSFSPTGTNPATRGFIATGNITTMLVWCPTARDRTNGGDTNARNLRTSDVCFMRGLKEKVNVVNFQDSTAGQAANWKWRRVCFTAKGLWQALGTSAIAQETSNGWVRFLADQGAATFGSVLRDIMFKGVQDTDWNDIMNAPLDNGRITVKYDVTRTLNTGSGAKKFWNYNIWHPMNKNLVYDNDEAGGSEDNLHVYSTLSKNGMGDYLVVDILQCAQNNANDQLMFSPEATLYWHEK